MSGVVFVEMAMEAARQHLGPEAQLRDVQMVWPFVVPKARVEWVESLQWLNRCAFVLFWPGQMIHSSQKMSIDGLHDFFFLQWRLSLALLPTAEFCSFHPQDGDSDAKQMTMRLAIIGGSFILGRKQMEINSTRKNATTTCYSSWGKLG